MYKFKFLDMGSFVTRKESQYKKQLHFIVLLRPKKENLSYAILALDFNIICIDTIKSALFIFFNLCHTPMCKSRKAYWRRQKEAPVPNGFMGGLQQTLCFEHQNCCLITLQLLLNPAITTMRMSLLTSFAPLWLEQLTSRRKLWKLWIL